MSHRYATLIPRITVTLGSLGLFLGLAGCMTPQRAAEMEAAAAARSPLTGKSAPRFTLPNEDGKLVQLSDYRGQWVVLYFYPADGTPGCTCQAREFTRTHREFQKLTAAVLGVSPDTVASHRQFVRDFDLKVTLLADPDYEVMPLYGAAVKSLGGMRVIRSTVLINPTGTIVYHWPEVIPQGHASRVRAKLAELKSDHH